MVDVVASSKRLKWWHLLVLLLRAGRPSIAVQKCVSCTHQAFLCVCKPTAHTKRQTHDHVYRLATRLVLTYHLPLLCESPSNNVKHSDTLTHHSHTHTLLALSASACHSRTFTHTVCLVYLNCLPLSALRCPACIFVIFIFITCVMYIVQTLEALATLPLVGIPVTTSGLVYLYYCLL